METLTIVLLVGVIFAVIGAIYAGYKYNKNYNISVANPRFKSFYTAGGQQPVLSCPVGYVIAFTGSQDKSYYLGPYNGTTPCTPIDITADIATQASGKNSATLRAIPANGTYSGTQKLDCTTTQAFAYGQYRCVLA